MPNKTPGFVVELISGLGTGALFVLYLLKTDRIQYDLLTSILLLAMFYYIFSFIGIGVAGLLVCNKPDRRYLLRLLNCLIFLIIGIIFSYLLVMMVPSIYKSVFLEILVLGIVPPFMAALGFNYLKNFNLDQ